MIACIYPPIISYHHLSIFSTACHSPSVSNRNRFKDATYCFRDRPPAPQRSLSPVPGNIKLCTGHARLPLLPRMTIQISSQLRERIAFVYLYSLKGASITDVTDGLQLEGLQIPVLHLDLLLGITHLIEASTIACLAPQSGWYGSLLGDLYIYAYVYRYICICMCACICICIYEYM